ncbi:MAG: hypothetical protein Q4D63_02005 [Neisseria animaloris]|nr:hypothetical protein [Neisseria animaloris]
MEQKIFGLPLDNEAFANLLPNQITIEAMEELEQGRGFHYRSVEELVEDIFTISESEDGLVGNSQNNV